MKVLLVEDDPKIVDMLGRGLAEEGCQVEVASDGVRGLELLLSERFEICVLDLLLPGLGGLKVIETARAVANRTPILVLTARDEVADRVLGLDLGADDYLTKPFAFAELLARMRAVLRRGPEPRPATLRLGDLFLDLSAYRAELGGVELDLSRLQFALLECLMRNAGEVVSRSRLLEEVFGYHFDPGTNLVDVHVAHLRRKIDRPGKISWIATVRGVGYRFDKDRDA